MVSTVETAGFVVFPTGKREPSVPARIPLRRLDAEREDQVLRDGFAGVAGRERATAILERCADWHPDLIVCDETDFGSMVAAERLGLAYATVLVIAAGSFVRHELITEPLNELRAAHGLPPDLELEMLSRYLVVSPFPPSFRDPTFPLPATAHTIRPLLIESTGADMAPWITDLGNRPTVYATLGTVFNVESGDLFARMIAGLRDLPVNVVVTVGRHIDPEEFGPQPANVRVEHYIPQSELLPRCDVVVSHGGSGSVIGALAHGLPSVVIPMGGDQPHNGARCEALGVGRVLDAMDATPEDIRDAVSAVLANPAYRRAAERIRDEIGELLGTEHALALLERLTAEKRPLLAR
jgi:UDP:flavonoid glycosyltransferase YjiC (YdhE family)